MASANITSRVEQNGTTDIVTSSANSYVSQWNHLVSTTNWEKGRIICAWREALVAEGAAAADYSDEAWALLVGGVTGQHVGRLRRTYQQFGQVWQEYPGLYWSHFQVAMDFDDAEMWLEGAVQNGWSVAQMRAARWQAHGAPEELKPRDEDVIVAELDEDLVAAVLPGPPEPATSSVRNPSAEDSASDEATDTAAPAATKRDGSRVQHQVGPEDTLAESGAKERRRPFADLPDLPDDVAEAFEQFKLVILAHKLAGWKEIARDDLLSALDALKELAQLPSEG